MDNEKQNICFDPADFSGMLDLIDKYGDSGEMTAYPQKQKSPHRIDSPVGALRIIFYWRYW